jgi:hypothetical protein
MGSGGIQYAFLQTNLRGAECNVYFPVVWVKLRMHFTINLFMCSLDQLFGSVSFQNGNTHISQIYTSTRHNPHSRSVSAIFDPAFLDLEVAMAKNVDL